jgi:activator of 2-hydroxyglutaryl-CoA dehydratase
MQHIVGIDIGSVALSVVEMDEQGAVINSLYQFHQGAIADTLRSMLGAIDIEGISGVAMTESGPDILENVPRYDTQIAMIAAVKKYHEKAGSILFVGGENFGLITFNKQGEYERFRSNSSCAAGTGSFLDQQARRLNLKSIETLSTVAFCNQMSTPKIATRCAVFAKTDLIHAQQEGYSVGQISDGLCEGLAKNVIDTLIPDSNIHAPLILAGGVSMNSAVVKHFRHELRRGQTFQEPFTGRTGHRRAQPPLRRDRRGSALSGRKILRPVCPEKLGRPVRQRNQRKDLWLPAADPRAFHIS